MGDLGLNLIIVVNSFVNLNDKYMYDEVMKY